LIISIGKRKLRTTVNGTEEKKIGGEGKNRGLMFAIRAVLASFRGFTKDCVHKQRVPGGKRGVKAVSGKKHAETFRERLDDCARGDSGATEWVTKKGGKSPPGGEESTFKS